MGNTMGDRLAELERKIPDGANLTLAKIREVVMDVSLEDRSKTQELIKKERDFTTNQLESFNKFLLMEKEARIKDKAELSVQVTRSCSEMRNQMEVRTQQMEVR